MRQTVSHPSWRRVLLCILMLGICTRASAGPSCNRVFEFIGFVTESDSAFIIGTSDHYMCEDQHVIRIVVQSDSARSVEDVGIGKGAWTGVARFIETLHHEKPLVFNDSLDDWIKLENDLKIRLGEPTPGQQEQFAKWRVAGIEPWFWNRDQKESGIVMPEVQGDSLMLISYYPNGLYYNYRFKQVFYFPRSGYVLILTHNDRYVGEFDSEHGYLLLKLEGR